MAKTVLDTISENTPLEQGSEPMAELAQRSGLQSAADLAAERAAFAAEAAAQAAQRAVGLMERAGAWMGLLINRAAQQEPALMAPMAKVSEPEAGAGGITDKFKRAAASVSERISDWSDGRYGLTSQQPDKKAMKAAKKSAKQSERLVEKAAKESAKHSEARWFPWMIGLSIGLIVGLIGVAYWQRQRLQHLWGETSQRVQQATDTMRQRIETSRSPNPEMLPRDMPTATPNFRPLGSAASVSDADQTTNGRREPANQ